MNYLQFMGSGHKFTTIPPTSVGFLGFKIGASRYPKGKPSAQEVPIFKRFFQCPAYLQKNPVKTGPFLF